MALAVLVGVEAVHQDFAQQQVLIDRTVSLEKANGTLKRLLNQREIEKKAIEQAMVGILNKRANPQTYLNTLA